MSSINFNNGGNKLKDIKIRDGVLHFKEEQLVNKSYVDQALLSIGGAGGELTSLVFFNTNDLAESSTNKYVSPTEKATWNAKSNFDGNYNSLINKPNIDVNKLYVDTALENKIDKVTGSQLIETTDLASLNCHKNNVTNPHQTSINNLVNTNIVNPINNQWLAYNATTSKWENKTLTIAADEKLKATINSASAKYLNELIDNNTIIMTSDKLICKSIDGITRAELLTLVGMDANIKSTLNTLATAGMTFKGVKNRKSDLTSMTGMLTGELYIVLVDESLNNLKTSYIYDGSSWMSLGESNVNIRNFSIDKLNLVTEAKGILPQLNMDLTGLVKTTDLNNYVTSTYLTANYASKADLSTKVNSIDIYSKAESDNKYVEKIVGKSLVSNTDIYKIHTHSNMEILDSITSEKITEWDSNSSPITTLSQLTNDTNFISDVDYVHTDSNYTSQDKYKVSKIITTGDGTKFKSDDGTYKTVISGSSGVGINDLSVSPTTTYSSTKITGITGDITTLSTTNKSSLVNAINEVFQDGINVKQNIVTAVNSKGQSVATSNTWTELTTAISNISTGSTIKNTRLNLIAPTTHTEILTKPTSLQGLATSVIKYTQGGTGVTGYSSNFNNGDGTNFTYPDTVAFDGTMHLTDTSLSLNTTNSGSLIDGQLFTSDLINVGNFNSVETIIVTDDTTPTLVVSGSCLPNTVIAKSDIDLTGILSLSQIIWTTSISGSGILNLAISVDGALTWKSFNGITWNTLNINNLSDFKTNGMTPSMVNELTKAQLESLRGTSEKIRFAYYIEKVNISDIANNDAILLTVDMEGSDRIAPQSDFSYTLGSDMKTIIYTINTSGTYTFVYSDAL